MAEEELHPVLVKIPKPLLAKLDKKAKEDRRDRVDEILYLIDTGLV